MFECFTSCPGFAVCCDVNEIDDFVILPGVQKPVKRIVFLDIDGVLHPAHTDTQAQRFTVVRMALLRELLDLSGARVVLSTGWRLKRHNFDTVNAHLKMHEIQPVLGRTEHMPGSSRADEILRWVDAWDPEEWIIIDDMDLSAEPRFRDHFVRTDPDRGLTTQTQREALRLFGIQRSSVVSVPSSI